MLKIKTKVTEQKGARLPRGYVIGTRGAESSYGRPAYGMRFVVRYG